MRSLTTGLARAIAAIAILCSATVGHAQNLNLSQGTMSIGGAFGFTSNGAISSPFSTMNINGSFDWQYFVIDNWSWGLQAAANFPLASAGTIIDTGRFSVISAYYFDAGGVIFPYLGASVGVGIAGAPGTPNFAIPVSGKVGFLVGLNEHVALDFGANALFNIPVTGSNSPTAQIGVGYIGVRGFF